MSPIKGVSEVVRLPRLGNLSLGAEDDGDEDSPVRAACRQANQEYGLDVIAAAGNAGPRMTTVTLPACDPEVIAVGTIETTGELAIWDKSSRGPTVQGEPNPTSSSGVPVSRWPATRPTTST